MHAARAAAPMLVSPCLAVHAPAQAPAPLPLHQLFHRAIAQAALKQRLHPPAQHAARLDRCRDAGACLTSGPLRGQAFTARDGWSLLPPNSVRKKSLNGGNFATRPVRLAASARAPSVSYSTTASASRAWSSADPQPSTDWTARPHSLVSAAPPARQFSPTSRRESYSIVPRGCVYTRVGVA